MIDVQIVSEVLVNGSVDALKSMMVGKLALLSCSWTFSETGFNILSYLSMIQYTAFSSAIWIKTKTPWQAIKSILFDRAHEFAEHFLRTEKQHHLSPGSLICKIRLPGRQWFKSVCCQ